MSGYNPKPETEKWLNRALEIVEALPYRPTARYVFYRIHQELGFPKSVYKTKFLQTTAKARKRFWNGWRPDTFADDTRSVLSPLGTGYASPKAWFDSMANRSPMLDITNRQDNLVIVCFEAKAMVGQFRHYLEDFRIPLCAFGGDVNIDYKWSIARSIARWHDKWPDKPVIVLYFGDYDEKGLEIPENAMRDIRRWSGVDFTFVRCGINEEHIGQYNIPDSPEEQDKYQWEAVPDEGAEELILGNVKKYWDSDIVDKVKEMEDVAGDIWGDVVEEAIERAHEEYAERFGDEGFDDEGEPDEEEEYYDEDDEDGEDK